MRRWDRGEDGSALIELFWFGVLLTIPLIYILTSVFVVQRGSFAVAGAARAGARAYALADDPATGQARAQAAVAQVMSDYDQQGPTVTITCNVPDCAAPEAVVTVSVGLGVKLPLLPDFFGEDRSQINVSSRHAVPLGRYRETAP